MAKENEDNRSLNDIIGDLKYGDPAGSYVEPETTDEDSTEEAPTEESTSEAEQSEVQSKEDEESPESSETEAEASESESEGGEGEAEDTESEPEGDGNQTITIDGEDFTLDEVREWRKDGLRQADYTRKSQALAAERKEAEEAAEATSTLTEEIVSDPVMGEFIKAHPVVLPKLLADAKNTRAILGNAEEVQALWDDYELIADNPRLAERFTSQPEAAQDELVNQREADNVMLIANALDAKVDELAQGFEGVDSEEVKQHILQLGRVPTGDAANPQATVDAFGRLYTLMFVTGEDGQVGVDPALIVSRFEMLAGTAARDTQSKDEKAEEHNAQVDAKLTDTSKVPASKGGSGPAPESEQLKPAKDVNEVIHGLLGYDD